MGTLILGEALCPTVQAFIQQMWSPCFCHVDEKQGSPGVTQQPEQSGANIRLVKMTSPFLLGLCCFVARDKSVGPEFRRQIPPTQPLGQVTWSLGHSFCPSVSVSVSVFVSLFSFTLVPSLAIQLRAWGFGNIQLPTVWPWAWARVPQASLPCSPAW